MKPRRLDLENSPQAAEHEALGLPPLETSVTHAGPHPWRRDVWLLLGFLVLAALVYGLGHWLLPEGWRSIPQQASAAMQHEGFWLAVMVGLFAQIIDGALGMAYGITATTFLLSTGVPPAAASASVHMAEVFTTGFSGLSHWRMGNIDKALFKRLLIPGIVGAVVGAWVITSVDGNAIKPWISAYLVGMGLYVLSKAFRKIKKRKEPPKHVAALALTGGFVDSVGGGGWGPVVTTSLIGTGHDPRTTIGSVNAAEFFLSIAGGLSFALLIGFTHWQVIAGLVVGGLFAAPFAAWLCKHLPARTLLIMVGVLITVISTFNLWKALS
ncbi:MAG: sulfite exporter TauE/SafE family protein [Moraxellaceae bacterium]